MDQSSGNQGHGIPLFSYPGSTPYGNPERLTISLLLHTPDLPMENYELVALLGVPHPTKIQYPDLLASSDGRESTSKVARRLVTGDFSSPNTTWGYNHTNHDEAVEDWPQTDDLGISNVDPEPLQYEVFQYLAWEVAKEALPEAADVFDSTND